MERTIDVYHGTGKEIADAIQYKQQPLYGYSRTNLRQWSPTLTDNPGYALQWAPHLTVEGDKYAILKFVIPERYLINYGSQPSLYRNQCYGTNRIVRPEDLPDAYLARIGFSRAKVIELTETGNAHLGIITFFQVPYEWLRDVEVIDPANVKTIKIS